jgi:acyl carrier protein phosphodiesterase
VFDGIHQYPDLSNNKIYSMNFLAHIYLSGSSDEFKVGNFIGDYVKGKDYEKFPPEIRKGILMHRGIDWFTDNHPIVRQSKTYFTPRYHKFSGIIIDIFYDHFLANEWNSFSDENLHDFVDSVNKVILKYADVFPEGIKKIVPYFIADNWFETYASIEGIEKILMKMSQRTSLPYEDNYAIEVLKDKYNSIRDEFLEFFPQIINFVEENHAVTIKRVIR